MPSSIHQQSSAAESHAKPRLKRAGGRVSKELAKQMREASDLQALLEIMSQALQAQTGLDGFLFNLHEPASKTLVCALAHLPPPFNSAEIVYKEYTFPTQGDDGNAQAFSNNLPFNITLRNLASTSGSTRLRFERWKIHHLVILPLQTQPPLNQAAGTVMLFSQQKTLRKSLMAWVQELVAEATPLIRLHQQLAAWEKRARSISDTEGELAALLQFVAEMNNLTTDRDIYRLIQREFMRRFDVDLAALFMLENGELRCVDNHFDLPDAPWAEEWRAYAPTMVYAPESVDGATGDTFSRNARLYFGDAPALRDLPMSPKDRKVVSMFTNLQSFATFPIRKQGAPIGVLWLSSFRRKNAMSPDDLTLAQHLCDFLGSVIENARTYTLVQRQREEIESLLNASRNQVQVLDHLASRDHLTGLYNFGSFEGEAIERIHAYRQQQDPQPLSMIMCDVDHFKDFNDTFGHVAGNAVLKEIATRIKQTVRDSDYVARYGGEEFAVLLPRCDLEAACGLAERIRLNVEQQPFIVDGIPHHLTISLGCAQYATRFEKFSDFTAHADGALYEAKHAGRNRVEKAEI
jgi:diguanylate cyclase (GGDEF)-like protein